ncbi:MAG TPA: hypothetical protein VIL27_09605 [Clostridia bacterium]
MLDGYGIDYGTSPFEVGIQRLSEHSRLDYIGMLAVRDIDDQASFQTPEAIATARKFARLHQEPEQPYASRRGLGFSPAVEACMRM